MWNKKVTHNIMPAQKSYNGPSLAEFLGDKARPIKNDAGKFFIPCPLHAHHDAIAYNHHGVPSWTWLCVSEGEFTGGAFVDYQGFMKSKEQ